MKLSPIHTQQCYSNGYCNLELVYSLDYLFLGPSEQNNAEVLKYTVYNRLYISKFE